ncbi:Type I secretion system membrane fusion protein PrsE [Planctomycetes bacterium Poly30]|uniref:Type I secretion system membrane fusion protein PrsE n=1 Tax=Saltatorellus ferox TaxID=2528018 RepID=A0A518EY74_9BACT|nr:Type I secretion system membrane fusion protein PrsE [Planctomycetes bacterium Poly30]
MSSNGSSTSAPSLELPVQHLIGRSRAGRKLAIALGSFLVILPVLLIFVPWQQNVPGVGRVTALNPLDRIQVIPAPVSGRLTKLNVREGSRVQKGDELAVMEDLDKDFAARLDLQEGFARDKVEFAHTVLESLDAQLLSLESSRTAALVGADADISQAIEKVSEAESKLEAEEKKLEFLQEDFGRQSRLLAQGQASVQKQQKAEADFGEQRAKVAAARAAVAQARSERDSKRASRDKINASEQAKIDEVTGKEQEAQQKLQDAKKALTEIQSDVARQATRVILAPRDGTILRAAGANSSDLISRGEPLMEIVPDTERLAVELWMRGVDAPLVQVGRQSRLQFEGWPAVQFAGWPSVAVGTFGGVVAQVDAQAASDGRVRVLVVPDPTEPAWPEEQYLRQGVRASGWIQLETVSSGYEVWRQLNAFPPSIRTGPPTMDGGSKAGGKAKDDGGDKGKK